jgi:predicted dehydrogenase
MGDPQAYGHVAEMLARPDIDAVYIATPHNHHFPDGMQALKAGKHVLIEKPFALNLGEGRELQAEAARQGSWRWRRCGAITRRSMM